MSLAYSLDCIYWRGRTQRANGSMLWVWPPNCVRGKNEDWAVRMWAFISLCAWLWMSRDQLLYFLPPELPAMMEGNLELWAENNPLSSVVVCQGLRSQQLERKQTAVSWGGWSLRTPLRLQMDWALYNSSSLSLVPSPPTSRDPAHSPVPQAPNGVRLPGERLHAPLLNLKHKLLRPHMGLVPQDLWPKQNSHHHSRLLKCSLEPQVRGHTTVDTGKPLPSLSDDAEHLLIRSKAIPFPLQV